MGPVQPPMHSERREMHTGISVCWLYAASAVHKFSSERASPSSSLGPRQQPAWLSQHQESNSCRANIAISFSPTSSIPMYMHTFETPGSHKILLNTTHAECSSQKRNLQQLNTFSIVSKVHGGCVGEQWAEASWARFSPVACASTELQLHTVRTVDLLDFVFWQQMERDFSWRSPKAGRSGQWGAVLLQLFLFAKSFPADWRTTKSLCLCLITLFDLGNLKRLLLCPQGARNGQKSIILQLAVWILKVHV